MRLHGLAVVFAAAVAGVSAARAGDLPFAPQPEAIHEAYWSTPGDGTLTMLLRDAKDFLTPIPFRVQVCVTNFVGSNNHVNLLVWTTQGYTATALTAPQEQTRQLALGECATIDQPNAVIVQDSTTSGIASGFYRLYERTPPAPAYVNSASAELHPFRRRHDADIKIGDPSSRQAPCAMITDQNIQNRNYYNAACPLVLDTDPKPNLTQKAFRICAGAKYVESAQYDGAYALSLLDMVISESALYYVKPSPYDYNFSPFTGQVCHDVFHTNKVWFMVGPAATGGYWDASKVRAIDVTVQTLTWTAEPTATAK